MTQLWTLVVRNVPVPTQSRPQVLVHQGNLVVQVDQEDLGVLGDLQLYLENQEVLMALVVQAGQMDLQRLLESQEDQMDPEDQVDLEDQEDHQDHLDNLTPLTDLVDLEVPVAQGVPRHLQGNQVAPEVQVALEGLVVHRRLRESQEVPMAREDPVDLTALQQLQESREVLGVQEDQEDLMDLQHLLGNREDLRDREDLMDLEVLVAHPTNLSYQKGFGVLVTMIATPLKSISRTVKKLNWWSWNWLWVG